MARAGAWMVGVGILVSGHRRLARPVLPPYRTWVRGPKDVHISLVTKRVEVTVTASQPASSTLPYVLRPLEAFIGAKGPVRETSRPMDLETYRQLLVWIRSSSLSMTSLPATQMISPITSRTRDDTNPNKYGHHQDAVNVTVQVTVKGGTRDREIGF